MGTQKKAASSGDASNAPPPDEKGKRGKLKFPKANPSLEYEYLVKLRDKFENPLLGERLYYLLIWYGWKSEHHKKCYHHFRTLSAILLGGISILSVCSAIWPQQIMPVITVVISAIVTFINQRTDQYRYYENWVRYRGAAEKLKREAYLFLSRCDTYANEKPEENERKLAATIEDIAAEEHTSWKSLYDDSFQKYQEKLAELEAKLKQSQPQPPSGNATSSH